MLFLFQTEVINATPPGDFKSFMLWSISILIATVIGMVAMYTKSQKRLADTYEAQIKYLTDKLKIEQETNIQLLAEIKPALESMVKIVERFVNSK